MEKNNVSKKNDLDIGFRCFKLEDKRTRPLTTLDMLFEVMLDLGYTLSLPLETTTIGTDCIYNVNQGELVACFTKSLTEREAELIVRMKPKQICLSESELAESGCLDKLKELTKKELNWDATEFDINVKTFGMRPAHKKGGEE